jgi:hypothetical protein
MLKEARKSVFHDKPDGIEIYTKIIMDENIS